MSWLLKDETVLSSAVIFSKRSGIRAYVRAIQNHSQESVVLLRHHFVHSLLAKENVVVVVCNSANVVTGLRSLKPNRIGGLVLHSGAIIIIPARTMSHIDLHVGDQLEIR